MYGYKKRDGKARKAFGGKPRAMEGLEGLICWIFTAGKPCWLRDIQVLRGAGSVAFW